MALAVAHRLNYMSTDEILAALCHARILFLWEPKYEGTESRHRRIYVTRDVRDWLLGPTGGVPAGGVAYREYLKAIQYAVDAKRYLKSFVVGQPFDDDEKLKNLDTSKQLADAGRWELRLKRHPQTRIFGGFPCPNAFVVSHVEPRAVMDKAKTGWEVQKSRILTFWDGLQADSNDSTGQSCKIRLPLMVGMPRSILVSAARTLP